MVALKMNATIDPEQRLTAKLPHALPAGPIEVIVIFPDAQEDDAGHGWAAGIAREWADELADPREDLYTLADGAPVDEGG